MLKPKELGTIHEEECKLFFLKLGYSVSVPIGENMPYDFILDAENSLFKIQCKKPSLLSDRKVLYIECTSNINTRTRLETVDYRPECVDYFASVYNGMCYLIPFTGQRSYTLRLGYPKSAASYSNIHWAQEFEGDYVLNRKLHPDTTPARDMLSTYIEHVQPKLKYESEGQFMWITDGQINKRFTGHEDEIPYGFKRGRCRKCNQYS